MPEPDPKPTPEPVTIDWSKWATPVSVLLLGAVLLYQQVKGPIVPTPGPTPPPPVIVEPVKFDPETTIVLQDGKVLSKIKAKPVIDAVNNGNATYTVRGFVEGKAEETRTVTVSGGLVPVPVPPKPDPPGPPIPPKPDVISGPRGILIIQQVENESDAFSAMMVKLRSGASAEYLKSKGHKLYHLDPDDTGANGQPSEIVEAWRPHFKDMKLPVEIIFDPATKQLLSKRELPDTTTDANVIESVRQQGG